MEMEGYQFVPDEKTQGLFHAKILSFLSIKFEDEKTGEPIQDVLVQVSSKDFKQYPQTDESGKVKFVDLFSGQYVVLPWLKEYKFSPKQMVVDISDGERVEKTIKATRISYSVFGKASFFNKNPISEMTVVAQSTDDRKDHSESAVTDENGNYRIRGLEPGTEYEIRVVNDDLSKLTDRFTPETQKIQIGEEEVRGVDFLAFKRS